MKAEASALSATFLAQTLLRGVQQDLQRFEEIVSIIDQHHRSLDHHEVSLLKRYGVFVDDREMKQAVAHYARVIDRYGS